MSFFWTICTFSMALKFEIFIKFEVEIKNRLILGLYILLVKKLKIDLFVFKILMKLFIF